VYSFYHNDPTLWDRVLTQGGVGSLDIAQNSGTTLRAKLPFKLQLQGSKQGIPIPLEIVRKESISRVLWGTRAEIWRYLMVHVSPIGRTILLEFGNRLCALAGGPRGRPIHSPICGTMVFGTWRLVIVGPNVGVVPRKAEFVIALRKRDLTR
jgi:hypothetical protein